MRVYRIFGLTVSSDLALPGIATIGAAGDEGHRAADVRVRCERWDDRGVGARTTSVDARRRSTSTVDVSLALDVEHGVARLAVPGVAVFRVSGGREIRVSAEPRSKAADVRSWLLGSTFALLLLQRRALPLHASAVELRGRAVLLCGPSGAGKSTLAAFFGASGSRVISDDVSPIEISDDGLRIRPGIARVKLAREAAFALAEDPSRLRAADGPRAKLEWPIERPVDVPLPLAAIVHLRPESASRMPELVRVEGPVSLALLARSTYRRRFLHELGLDPWHFRACADIARSTRSFEARYALGWDRLPDVVAWLSEELAVSCP